MRIFLSREAERRLVKLQALAFQLGLKACQRLDDGFTSVVVSDEVSEYVVQFKQDDSPNYKKSNILAVNKMLSLLKLHASVAGEGVDLSIYEKDVFWDRVRKFVQLSYLTLKRELNDVQREYLLEVRKFFFNDVLRFNPSQLESFVLGRLKAVQLIENQECQSVYLIYLNKVLWFVRRYVSLRSFFTYL